MLQLSYNTVDQHATNSNILLFSSSVYNEGGKSVMSSAQVKTSTYLCSTNFNCTEVGCGLKFTRTFQINTIKPADTAQQGQVRSCCDMDI